MILDVVALEMSMSPPTERPYSPSPPGTRESSPTSSHKPFQFSGPQKVLRLRLGPLQQIQKDLEAMLGSASSEPVDLSTSRASVRAAAFLDNDTDSDHVPLPEFSVRSDCGWKSVLNKVRMSSQRSHNSVDGERPKASLKRAEEVSDVIRSCGEDMKALWGDPLVRDLLKKRNVVLEDQPGL
jgi:guanine nucleotide-binding protein alpha-1 subunit